MIKSLIPICIILTVFISSCDEQQVNEVEIEDEPMQQGETPCFSNIENEYPVIRPEGTFCTSDICDQYLNLWEELIKEHNNFDQDFFDTHIKLYRTSLNDWVQGISFRVCYEYQVDWAIAYACDSYIINIDPENGYFLSLNLPKDQYLTKKEIKIAIDHRAFASDLTTINPITILKRASYDEAMDDLALHAGVDVLCFNRLSLHRDSGNLIINAGAIYNFEDNACIQGTVDLITGEQDAFDTLCFI